MSAMLRSLSGLACAFFVALINFISSPCFAALIIEEMNPFDVGVTTSYRAGPADYMSVQDAYAVPPNSLTSVNFAQGGVPIGLNTHIGLAETFTTFTGSTRGAPNDSGFTLNRVTAPLSGGDPNLVVTLNVYRLDTLSGSGLHDGASAWPVTNPKVYTGTFPWNPPALPDGAEAWMTTLYLQGEGPVIDHNTTYAIAFEWDVDSSISGNSLIWYRLQVGPTEPGGQAYRLRSPSEGYLTLVATGGSGGAPRTFAMALNAVPEPGAVILVALGFPALVFTARRQNIRH